MTSIRDVCNRVQSYSTLGTKKHEFLQLIPWKAFQHIMSSMTLVQNLFNSKMLWSYHILSNSQFTRDISQAWHLQETCMTLWPRSMIHCEWFHQSRSQTLWGWWSMSRIFSTPKDGGVINFTASRESRYDVSQAWHMHERSMTLGPRSIIICVCLSLQHIVKLMILVQSLSNSERWRSSHLLNNSHFTRDVSQVWHLHETCMTLGPRSMILWLWFHQSRFNTLWVWWSLFKVFSIPNDGGVLILRTIHNLHDVTSAKHDTCMKQAWHWDQEAWFFAYDSIKVDWRHCEVDDPCPKSFQFRKMVKFSSSEQFTIYTWR
jgi:hypothetical protein